MFDNVMVGIDGEHGGGDRGSVNPWHPPTPTVP
jgi:hypothetical protein